MLAQGRWLVVLAKGGVGVYVYYNTTVKGLVFVEPVIIHVGLTAADIVALGTLKRMG